MSTIRKIFKRIVDHFTMNPEWVQKEVSRMSEYPKDVKLRNW